MLVWRHWIIVFSAGMLLATPLSIARLSTSKQLELSRSIHRRRNTKNSVKRNIKVLTISILSFHLPFHHAAPIWPNKTTNMLTSTLKFSIFVWSNSWQCSDSQWAKKSSEEIQNLCPCICTVVMWDKDDYFIACVHINQLSADLFHLQYIHVYSII